MSSNEMTVVNGVEYPAELVNQLQAEILQEYSDKLQELADFAKATHHALYVGAIEVEPVSLPDNWSKHYADTVSQIIKDGQGTVSLIYATDFEYSVDGFWLINILNDE